MTREEAMDYRRSCPYDAMGDFTIFEQTVGNPKMKEQKVNRPKEEK